MKTCPCPLAGSVEVKYAGILSSRICLCGESPGVTEIQKNKPFIGRSGVELENCLEAAGIYREELFILNAARCRIPRKEDGGTDAVVRKILKACRPNVKVILRAAKKKKVIVALGSPALRQILGKSGITKHRGRWVWSDEFNAWVMPSFHPAYILRNPSLRPKLIEDLKRVAELRNNDFNMHAKQEQTDYKEVQDLSELFKMQTPLWAAYDTETSGLDWCSPEFTMLACTVSVTKGQGWLVRFWEECSEEEGEFQVRLRRAPVGKKVKSSILISVKKCTNFKRKIKDLKTLLSSKHFKIHMHHATFDMHVTRVLFEREGLKPPSFDNLVMDTQAAAQLIDENLYELSSLETLQYAMTDFKRDYEGELVQKYGPKPKEDMPRISPEDLCNYACADTDVTLRASKTIKEQLLSPQNKRIANYYVHAVYPIVRYVLYEMEKNGSAVDLGKLPEAKDEVAEKANSAGKKALALIPPRILRAHKEKGLRLSRTQLVRDALYTKGGFNLKVLDKTATQQPSIGKDTLKKLLGARSIIKKAPKAKPLIENYMEWKQYDTLLTRYLKGFEKAVKPDGRIHSSFTTAKAKTGRLASSNPNMQNNPKRSEAAGIIRQLLIAPPGWKILAVDESQSELRWAAHLSEDKNMIQVFKSGKDIHTATAEAISGKKAAEMTKEEFKKNRTNAKPLNFGMLYLISVQGFVNDAKLNYGVNITERIAQEWMSAWFRKYSGITKYHAEMERFCYKHGYVESPFGNRRRLPEIYSNEVGIRNYAIRQAVNFPIQLASSTTVLIAMAELLMRNLLNPKECRIINFVHDEAVFEVRDKDSIIDRNYKIIKDIMENPPLHRFGINLKVPLVVDGKLGYNLRDMEEMN